MLPTLGQYLFDRIHDLFYTDIVRSIEEFRDFSLSSREGGFGNLLEIDESHVPVLEVIGQNSEMASQGRKLLVSLVRGITGHNQVPPEHRGYDLMSWLNVIFLGQRHYICIGSKQVKVQIKENGAAVVLDDFGVLCGGPAQGEFSPGIRDGVVEYYVIPRFSLGVLSVAVDGRNVFSVFSNDNNVTAREEFLREKRDRFRMQDTFEYLHQYLEKTIKESGAQEQSDSLIKEIEVGTSGIYGYLGSLPFGGHEGTVAKELLSVSGFYELFESDEQLVRSFALVSLLAGTGISVEEVRSVLAEQGFDYDQLLTRITRLEQKYSLELLRVSQDVVVTWI